MISLDVRCEFFEEIQRPELEFDVSLELNLNKCLYSFGENSYKQFEIVCGNEILDLFKFLLYYLDVVYSFF